MEYFSLCHQLDNIIGLSAIKSVQYVPSQQDREEVLLLLGRRGTMLVSTCKVFALFKFCGTPHRVAATYGMKDGEKEEEEEGSIAKEKYVHKHLIEKTGEQAIVWVHSSPHCTMDMATRMEHEEQRLRQRAQGRREERMGDTTGETEWLDRVRKKSEKEERKETYMWTRHTLLPRRPCLSLWTLYMTKKKRRCN